jgi:hypothetical protein
LLPLADRHERGEPDEAARRIQQQQRPRQLDDDSQGDAQPHAAGLQVQDDDEPGITAQQRRPGDQQAGDHHLAAPPECPRGGRERHELHDAEANPRHPPVGNGVVLRGARTVRRLRFDPEPREFCIACHTEYACQAGDRQAVEQTLRDGAAGDPRSDAALGFLTAFAAGPDAITPGHLERLRTAGVRHEAIRDLAQIAFAFCLINRIADALEFKVLTPAHFARAWPNMRDRGYRI